MIKLIPAVLFCLINLYVNAQLGVKYDPSIQSTTGLQYFKPKGDLFVGDAMPFVQDPWFFIKGIFLWFYAKHGRVSFRSIEVYPLLENN